MEDALNDNNSTIVMPMPLKSVEVDVTEEPKIDSEKEESNKKTIKVNGDTKIDNSDGTESSDYDNLVIDERPKNNRKRKQLPFSPEGGFKGFKRIKNEEEYEPPMNPYFNESLFELSELHNNKNVHSLEKSSNSDEKSSVSSNVAGVNQVDEIGSKSSTAPTSIQAKKFVGKKKKVGSPKLREYAQYLGLQPTVQFKCSRCALRGFSSLALLNEHQLECTGEGPISPPVSTQTTAPSTNFRVTRKVYLCSACGTYYENWNLFLHMREIHKRFICLYCLGMFSQPEKLSLHLVTKHNCVPSQLNSEEDFFHVYKEPCFLMCCECEKVFSERDNFFGHTCCGKTIKDVAENKSKTNNNTNANNHRQLINQKNNRNSKQSKNNKTFIEHVTGDTTVDSKKKMVEDQLEVNAKESEDVKEEEEEDETQIATEKEECSEENKESDPIETNENVDENQETVAELSKDVSPERSDGETKARDSESEIENNPESPRYESESPINQEETDCKEDEPIDENDATRSESEQGDTRKVPKVTLKLPKNTIPYVDHEDSDDSDKLMMEFDSAEKDITEEDVNVNDEKENKDPLVNVEQSLDVAGSEIPIIELELEHPLDKFDIQILLQKCLKETIPTCVYCNHARKIAVNGKQLGLHAIAEHRFSAIVNSITAEELIPESFVMRIKESLPELQNVYFNLESSAPEEGMTFSHVFECFQCRYATTIHKELYLHNRKMHAKTILLCIMCKSNFYSYSELICHLCPGLYELNNDVNFRCCMCVCDDLPSAFRLMVHLRKRHHACDVCLELCHNQSRLSNHVWKHKLHHLCYRCGIAYRNKPDITKHLFWKHGTESVLCKKCLQKKWPHVYHFCIPPSTFTCEECNLNFTKAVALKVHKRIHRDEKPHVCTFENCNEKFISKKLLLKHEFKHREPPEDMRVTDDQVKTQETQDTSVEDGNEKSEDVGKDENSNDAAEKKQKPRVDVYDLPELNLSESDSSDSEEEGSKIEKQDDVPKLDMKEESCSTIENEPEQRVSDEPVTISMESAPVLENIWDDFKLYQATKEKEKIENLGKSEVDTDGELPSTSSVVDEIPVIKQEEIVNIIMRDHDYSLLSQEYKTEPQTQQTLEGTSLDHDYCSSNKNVEGTEGIVPNDASTLPAASSPEKKEIKPSSTSDSSNDSDSSSCTCGSNCSCSGSSDSSSSSSDSSDSDSSSSEGRRKQQARRERRKRAKGKKESETSPIDVVATDNQAVAQVEQHIEESDLDTTETETDEDFYDKQPQKLASKLIAEKRKELMLLAGIGTLANGAVLESSRPSTPSLPETETLKIKKKSKNKKKKKKRKQDKPPPTIDIPSTSYQYPHQIPIVSPLTISLSKNSPLASPIHTPQIGGSSNLDEHMLGLTSDYMNISDSSLRASKRRRIPNKFYGYSSDEDAEKPQPPVLKWRKADLPSPARPTPNSPMVVPPITIKTIPPPSLEEPMPNRTANLNEMRMHIGFAQPNFQHNTRAQEESGSESNESSSEEEQPQPPPLLNKPPNQPPLYCYCRCPYDEVSEMIGCDADDCLIEWFHFECVGIMVPPKGQWFCPDCRKKKQQRKELALT